MMLFKFEFKYVKLNFKAIASMEFNFDINLCLSCSYDGCLFMKNHWKLLKKNSEKFKFHEIQSIEFRSLRRRKLESRNLGDKPSSRFWNPNRTVRSDPVNRKPFTKTVLLTPKTVLCQKVSQPYEPPGFENRRWFLQFLRFQAKAKKKKGKRRRYLQHPLTIFKKTSKKNK